MTGQDIDRGIVLLYEGPSSFTGEDVGEILLHGGRAVIASVLGALTVLGCRLAEPGEFARRAFENGKIDLTAAEGIADLIDAETEAQRRQAMAQAGGVLHRLYEDWRALLIDAMALIESGIDFSDEADISADATARARRIVEDLAADIDGHLADGRRGEILREGFRVVIAGPPNVGKSSLINALARRDVAIVSPHAGTTRDVIEVRLDLEGLPIMVSDTAGIREAGDEVEQEGIRRTISRGKEADLVVWVSDVRSPQEEVPREIREVGAAIVLVVNKVDLLAGDDRRQGSQSVVPMPTDSVVRVSAVTEAGVGDLVARIAREARERLPTGDGPVITQARHRAALEDCQRSLQEFLVQDLMAPELAAEDLRRAAAALGRITGQVDAEAVLGAIFARFCIGK